MILRSLLKPQERAPPERDEVLGISLRKASRGKGQQGQTLKGDGRGVPDLEGTPQQGEREGTPEKYLVF